MVSTDREERKGGYAQMKDEVSRIQLQTLDDNCERFGIREIALNDRRQGIQHEIDHLNGTVFVDHLSQLKQLRIKNKMAKQARVTA